MSFVETVETIGKGVEAAGVVAIVVGGLVATVMFLVRVVRSERDVDSYKAYRQALGRSILLGLEILVAGDIIRTVAATPSFTSVGVLAIIVLIRTFLSLSLEVELNGRFPWQESRLSGEGHNSEATDGRVA